MKSKVNPGCRIGFCLLMVPVLLIGCVESRIAAFSPTPEGVVQPETFIPAESVSPDYSLFPGCSVSYFEPVALFPDGDRLLVKNRQKIFIVSTGDWKQSGTFEIPILPDAVVNLSPDGNVLAYSNQQDYTITLVNMEDGKVISRLMEHTGLITDLIFTPDGDHLLSASHDTWVHTWDRLGNLVSSFQPAGADDFPSEVMNLAISPDGAMLATIPFNGPVKLWDMETHMEIAQMGGSGGYDTSDIAFSPDGQYLASDLATGLWIWRVPDGSLVMSGINTMAFAFSPDGRHLAYSDNNRDGELILIALDGLQVLHTLEGNLGWLVFFVDDTRLISINGSETRIWNMEKEMLLAVGCDAGR